MCSWDTRKPLMGIETAGSISMHSPGCSQKRSEKTLRKCLVWDRHERRNQQTPGGYKTLLDPFSRLLLRDTHFSLLGSSVHRILQVRILEWHFLLQEIFLTQGSNSGLLHCRQTLPCEPPGKNENQSIKNKVIFNVILCQGKLFHNQR